MAKTSHQSELADRWAPKPTLRSPVQDKPSDGAWLRWGDVIARQAAVCRESVGACGCAQNTGHARNCPPWPRCAYMCEAVAQRPPNHRPWSMDGAVCIGVKGLIARGVVLKEEHICCTMEAVLRTRHLQTGLMGAGPALLGIERPGPSRSQRIIQAQNWTALEGQPTAVGEQQTAVAESQMVL